MLECVPNVAEGRRPELVERIAAACGSSLLDVHADEDHHRSVFTLAGPGPDDAAGAVRGLTDAAVAAVDLSIHSGAHPRLGVVDVIPFVALDDEPGRAAGAALEFAHWLTETHGIPVFLYDDADPLRRSLPELRRDAFRRRRPDLGPGRPDPRLGASAVGARRPLIAVNCWLDTNDGLVASAIARAVRERDGGLPGVRALGIVLESQDVAQVSMNLVDLPVTGLEDACRAVRRAANREDFEVTQVEIVGLVQRAELERCTEEFRGWAGLTDALTLESRLEQQAGRGESAPGPGEAPGAG